MLEPTPGMDTTPAPTINQPLANAAIAAEQQTFITQVFAWMAAALCISGIVAFVAANSSTVINAVYGNVGVFYALLILEILLVVFLSARVSRMSLMAARATFLAYSGLNGLTLSIIFLVFSASSIAATFAVTAGTFGAMALYGYTTKRDLTSWGSLLMMFLVGLIIAGIVNMFWTSSTLYWTTTIIGIGVFVGLTAYDTQKIKNLNQVLDPNSPEEKKEAIMGALALYLDFINLFLYLLRFFGRRR